MVDATSLSAEEILANPWLFPKGEDADQLFKKLMKLWHPDHSQHPRASEVAAKITSQYQAARKGQFPNTLTLQTPRGVISYPYLAVVPFELGEVYICERFIIWATRREYDDLAKRWLETTRSFTYPDDKVKAAIADYLPIAGHNTLGIKDRTYTIVQRRADYVRLADILRKKGPLDPRHVAWVMSRAYNIAGYLNYAKITHLDISTETFFVEPDSHRGALLGGWFYSAKKGSKALAAPARSSHLSRSLETALDAQIRAMGRQLLASSVAALRADQSIPAALKSWVTGPASKLIPKVHEDWKKVLVASFGPPKFIPYELKTADIYGHS